MDLRRIGVMWLLPCSFLACGGSDDTCLETELEYAGSQQGVVYVKEREAHGRASGLATFPTVATALSLQGRDPLSGGSSCWGDGPTPDQRYEVTAWIDLAGDEREACRGSFPPPNADAGPVSPDYLGPACAPDPEDPSGQLTTVVKAHEYNVVIIRIVDPPK